MINTKDILVTTSPSIDGLIIRQYLKPISAHIVAGTNLFSDFVASFTDVFGGRSKTYQKQLSSLYSEAIERLKFAANEIGANCIIGLHVDLDEISGKGKSMFMVTAIGTAVIAEGVTKNISSVDTNKKTDSIGIDKIKVLQRKREIIQLVNDNSLELDKDVWEFITTNQMHEVYDYILDELKELIPTENEPSENFEDFYGKLLIFVDALELEKKRQLLYDSIFKNENDKILSKLYQAVEELQVLDLERIIQILNSQEFQNQKRALRIFNADKPFYNKEDLKKLKSLITIIQTKFPERGKRSTKKQFFSSKEKEIWICECGNSIDVGKYCGNCKKDIYGFTSEELSPPNAISLVEEKISLISEYLE